MLRACRCGSAATSGSTLIPTPDLALRAGELTSSPGARGRRRRSRAARTRPAVRRCRPCAPHRAPPDRLRPAGSGVERRLPRALATHPRVGVDQEHGTRRDAADAIRDRRRRAVIREDGGGGSHDGAYRPVDQPFRPGNAVLRVEALSDAYAGALGDDRREPGRLRRRFEQDLAADREAEAADAVRIDVAAAAQIVDRAEQIAISGLADGVALAPALPARIEHQDAVAVLDQHASLVGARRSREQDHCRAIGRRDVGGCQLQRVARRDGDALVPHAQVGRRRRSSRACRGRSSRPETRRR